MASTFHSVVLILVVLALVAVASAAYLGIVRPRSRMRAYREAVDLIAADRYRQALLTLTGLEGRLPERTRAEARFFMAFALYRSGDGDGAVYRLTALHDERPDDRDVSYLLAYIRLEQRQYSEAERVLAAVGPADLRDAPLRRLSGVVTFHRARQLLRDERVDTAAQLFEQAEQLGGFGDDVPDDLRSSHLVMGTRALFDKDLDTARTQFESLVEAAGTGSRTDGWTPAMAELGRTLVTWVEGSPGAASTVESRLTGVVRQLDPDGETEEAWPDATGGPSLLEQLAALDEATPARQADQPTRLLRDLHFLRGMAVLRAWAQAEIPVEQRDAVLHHAVGRFARARRLDPRFADPYLVVGMLRYHLARGPAERAQATVELQQARKLGARDPELLRVLNRERRAEQRGDPDVRMFDRFVTDGALPPEVRGDLLRSLNRYGPAISPDERPELVLPELSPPTVNELKERLELLGERVRRLAARRPPADGSDGYDASDGPDELATARDLARALEDDSRALAEQAESIRHREAQLLTLLSGWLLTEGQEPT